MATKGRTRTESSNHSAPSSWSLLNQKGLKFHFLLAKKLYIPGPPPIPSTFHMNTRNSENTKEPTDTSCLCNACYCYPIQYVTTVYQGEFSGLSFEVCLPDFEVQQL